MVTETDAAKALAERLCAATNGTVPETFSQWEQAARSLGFRLLEMDTGLPVRWVICEDCIFVANSVDEQDLRARIVCGLCKAQLRHWPEFTMAGSDVHTRIVALVLALLTTAMSTATLLVGAFPMCLNCLGITYA